LEVHKALKVQELYPVLLSVLLNKLTESLHSVDLEMSTLFINKEKPLVDLNSVN